MNKLIRKFNILFGVSMVTILFLGAIIIYAVVYDMNKGDQDSKSLVLANLPAYEELYKDASSKCHESPDPKSQKTLENLDEMLKLTGLSTDDANKIRDYVDYNQNLK